MRRRAADLSLRMIPPQRLRPFTNCPIREPGADPAMVTRVKEQKYFYEQAFDDPLVGIAGGHTVARGRSF